MGEIKIIGLDELKTRLRYCKKNHDMVRAVLHKNADQLNERMKGKMRDSYIKGYSTGDTAGSVNTIYTHSRYGMVAKVGPTTEYSPYIEYGTRFMEAAPTVRPAHEEQSKIFIHDMEELVK